MELGAFITILITLVIAGLLSSLIIWPLRKFKKEPKFLKCTSCGELSSIVITQNHLGHFGFGANFNESGFIDPCILDMYGTPIEDLIIGDQDKYSFCKKCGYYERIYKYSPNKANQL